MTGKPDSGSPMARHFTLPSDRESGRRTSFPERLLAPLIARIETLSSGAQYVIAALLIVLICLVDVVTGPELALSIFYLIPISLLAWHRDWAAARAAVIASGVAWLVADVAAGHRYTVHAILYWNALVRMAFFVIVAYALVQLRRAVNEEQRLARTDSLTGVANSRFFMEIAEREVARQHRYPHPLSIAFLDCDDFKIVNDEFGHATGDELLRRIARAVESATREVDVVARLGGDEFAILLPETDESAADRVCRKMRAALEAAGKEYGVTFSIGLVTYTQPAADVQTMVDAADQAMYEAKNSGKNTSRHRVIAGGHPEAPSGH